MKKTMIDKMVDRFLGWRLPEPFRPDAGISFTPEYNVEYMEKQGKPPMRHEPVGTNLFDADQARAMILHMLGDALKPLTETQAIRLANEVVPEIGRESSGNAVIAFVKAVEAEHGIGGQLKLLKQENQILIEELKEARAENSRFGMGA